MRVLVRLVVLFVFCAVLLELSPFALRSQAELRHEGGVIQRGVLQALQEDPEVAVIINLVAPEPVPGLINRTDLLRDNAERQERVLALLTPSDFTVTYQYSLAPALAGRITASAIAKLGGHPDVLTVSIDPQLFLTLGESVPLIRADEVHAGGLNGSGVAVAVLDSGIDTDHPDLQDDILGEACFVTLPPELGPGCPDDPNHPNYSPGHPAEDDNGHGTHVSGIITSNGTVAPKGVAPSAKIFAYKVAHVLGGLQTSDALAALNDILDITLSRAALGLPPLTPFVDMSFSDGVSYPAGTCRTGQTAMESTLGFLRLYGVLAFASSGNDGYKDGISWPACYPAVVSVGATYDADIGARRWPADPAATLTCEDPATSPDQVVCFSNSSADLDLLAPGSLTTSTQPMYFQTGFCSWEPVAVQGRDDCSGTSMAAPHAVGVAALLKQALPGLTVDEIENRLKLTGKWVTDNYDPSNVRKTPRVDARVALLQDAQDYDQDGCSNGEEFGSDEILGGLRNPLDFWDFYDTPDQNNVRDKVVDMMNDMFRVADRFGASGDPSADPLQGPIPPPPAYHTAFDRAPKIGPNVWNLGPADGTIDLFNDIFGVADQFGHSCVAPP